MSFVEAVKSAMSKPRQFSGRSRRSEYWWFSLFAGVVLTALFVLAFAMDSQAILIFACVVTGGLILPALAVSVRRLHDTGRSGWFYLLNFVPFGGIVLLVFFLQDSQPGGNAYGPNPKCAEAPTPVAPEAPVAEVAAEPTA